MASVLFVLAAVVFRTMARNPTRWFRRWLLHAAACRIGIIGAWLPVNYYRGELWGAATLLTTILFSGPHSAWRALASWRLVVGTAPPHAAFKSISTAAILTGG